MNVQRRPQRILLVIALVALVLVAALLWTQRGNRPAPSMITPVADSPIATARVASDAPSSPLASPQAQAQVTVTSAQQAPSPLVGAPLTATTNVSAAAAISPVATLVLSETVTVAERAPVTVSVQVAAIPVTGEIPVYGYQVVQVYPHDPEAFTQGLQYIDDTLFEGTGLRGRSSLRRVDLATGEVLQKTDLGPEYFGEGIVVVDDRIIQLTWQSNVAFVYDRESFAQTDEFSYPTEGWGITSDGEDLIMSDGSSTLFRRDPETFAERGQIAVQADGEPVILLNELEYIAGAVWANVWQTDILAIIDPQTGNVVGWVDLTGLLDTVAGTSEADVLNGIAYDVDGDRLFVTGKFWPALFEIQLVRN